MQSIKQRRKKGNPKTGAPTRTLTYSEAINYAAKLVSTGKLDEAERLCLDIVRVSAQDFNALHLLAIVQSQRAAFDKALRYFDQALRANPASYEVLYNRGSTLHTLKRYAEAIQSYDAALRLRPDCFDSLTGRGNALQALERHSEALASYDAALLLKPDHVETLSNRGNALQGLKRLRESVEAYDQALSHQPHYAEALNNRGVSLQAQGCLREALDSYNGALSVDPDYADAAWNKSMLLLLNGEFETGWPLYEWRWKRSDRLAAPPLAAPLWLGQEDLSGKRILLHAEQGFGDAIQFSRYTQAVAALGARVLLHVPKPLHPLLRNIAGAKEVIAHDQPLPQHDLQCPLMSLPLAFKTTLATIPARTPYLSAERERLAKWSARLGSRHRLRVGLTWAGNTQHKNDCNRSIAFATLGPLFSLPIDWVCLQKNIRDGEDAELNRLSSIAHFEEDIDDFADTAALIELCDLVLSVDTAQAHLAGALGKPVWLLLPFAPDWRWLIDREDSPWYPSARLFRQQRRGDWDSVIERVKRELEVCLCVSRVGSA